MRLAVTIALVVLTTTPLAQAFEPVEPTTELQATEGAMNPIQFGGTLVAIYFSERMDALGRTYLHVRLLETGNVHESICVDYVTWYADEDVNARAVEAEGEFGTDTILQCGGVNGAPYPDRVFSFFMEAPRRAEVYPYASDGTDLFRLRNVERGEPVILQVRAYAPERSRVITPAQLTFRFPPLH